MFIKEERAAIGGLEKTFAIIIGAGEGALAIAKELGLEQSLGIAPQFTATKR